MDKTIFRSKSLDKLKSPETLDDYIQVSNPGVWLLLASILVLLVGACVWGIFGHVDSTLSSAVRVEKGEAVCFVSQDDIDEVQVGMTVKFADQKAVITEIGEKGESGYVCTLSDGSAPDGYYEGRLVTVSYSPLSFVLN